MIPHQPEQFRLHDQTPGRGVVDVFRETDHLITHLPLTIHPADHLEAVLFCIGPVECAPHSYMRLTFRTQLTNRLKFPVDIGCSVVRSSRPKSKSGTVVLPVNRYHLTPAMLNLTISQTGLDLFKSGSGLKHQYYSVVLFAGSREARKGDVLQVIEEPGEFFIEHFIG
jgi:hypothetical protein